MISQVAGNADIFNNLNELNCKIQTCRTTTLLSTRFIKGIERTYGLQQVIDFYNSEWIYKKKIYAVSEIF